MSVVLLMQKYTIFSEPENSFSPEKKNFLHGIEVWNNLTWTNDLPDESADLIKMEGVAEPGPSIYDI